MSLESKKRLKEQYGRKAVVAYETLVYRDVALGVGGAVGLPLTDAGGIVDCIVKQNTKLDAVSCDLDAVLGGGETLSVDVLVDSVTVGTIDLVAGERSGIVTFETSKRADVNLVAGEVLELKVDKSGTSGDPRITARINLRVIEA